MHELEKLPSVGKKPSVPPRAVSREKRILRGLEAVGESALTAGMTQFYGVREAPQAELLDYLMGRMDGAGDHCVATPDETTAAGLLFGAACAGARTMSSGTGPGFTRMLEGISNMCSAEVGGVVVHVNRAGPGFGNLLPAQSDYRLVARGVGNGDSRAITLAPSSVQETAELTLQSFDLADSYRIPVILTLDAMIAQMMEPVRLPLSSGPARAKPWALSGHGKGKPRVITSIHWSAQALEEHNFKLFNKFQDIVETEPRFEEVQCGDAQVVVVAYGIMGRVAKTAIEKARKRGLKIGLFRPITLWPFPSVGLAHATRSARCVLVAELNMGQMVEDVRLALADRVPIRFYGRTGGSVPSPFEMMHEAVKQLS